MAKKGDEPRYRFISRGRPEQFTEPTYLAFDYRLYNVEPAEIIANGHKDVVVSWRQNDDATARVHLTTFRNAGVRIWITVEPWVRTHADDANVKSGWPSDDALWDLAEAHSGWLRDDQAAITNPVPEFWDDFGARTRGLDFSNATFQSAFSGWVNSRWPDIAGIYHDYGYPVGGLSWVNGYGSVPAGTWTTYAAGFQNICRLHRAHYPDRPVILGEYGTATNLEPALTSTISTSVYIEGAGPLQGELFTYQKAWQIARETRARGLRPMIWYLHTNAQARRLLACMAVATQGYLGRRTDVSNPLASPEMHSMTIGNVTELREIATNVWLAQGKKGHVVVNVSAGAHVYLGRSVAANDGLMVQEYGPNGGQLTPPLTNVGV